MSALHAALCALAAASPRGDLAFAPAPGTKVERTFEVEHALVLQDLKVDEGIGQVSQQQFELVTRHVLSVSDTLRESAGGRPLALKRVFGEGSLTVDLAFGDARGEKQTDTWLAATPLSGASVAFTWVPGSQVYGRHYDEVEKLEEYLSDLVEDLDLRVLLPEGDAKIGDAWTIPPARLSTVFSPGGRIPLGFTQGGGGFFARTLASGVGGGLAEVFGGEARGRAEARYASRREEEGRTLAIVALDLDLETERDQTGFARGTLSREELLLGRSVERAGVRWKFKGQGELAWDVAAGRFASFHLAGREEVTSELTIAVPGRKDPARQSVRMAGSLKLSARAR